MSGVGTALESASAPVHGGLLGVGLGGHGRTGLVMLKTLRIALNLFRE